MDDNDRASLLEQRHREMALSNFYAHYPWSEHESAHHCALCNEAIPEARRQTLPGVQHCVICQQNLENRWTRA